MINLSDLYNIQLLRTLFNPFRSRCCLFLITCHISRINSRSPRSCCQNVVFSDTFKGGYHFLERMTSVGLVCFNSSMKVLLERQSMWLTEVVRSKKKYTYFSLEDFVFPNSLVFPSFYLLILIHVENFAITPNEPHCSSSVPPKSKLKRLIKIPFRN